MYGRQFVRACVLRVRWICFVAENGKILTLERLNKERIEKKNLKNKIKSFVGFPFEMELTRVRIGKENATEERGEGRKGERERNCHEQKNWKFYNRKSVEGENKGRWKKRNGANVSTLRGMVV